MWVELLIIHINRVMRGVGDLFATFVIKSIPHETSVSIRELSTALGLRSRSNLFAGLTLSLRRIFYNLCPFVSTTGRDMSITISCELLRLLHIDTVTLHRNKMVVYVQYKKLSIQQFVNNMQQVRIYKEIKLYISKSIPKHAYLIYDGTKYTIHLQTNRTPIAFVSYVHKS